MSASVESRDLPNRRLAEDRGFLRRALELALRGEALTSPNPMVGAVVVKDERVVGEGFYTWDGLRHAEVIALEQAGDAARGATLYVNLEPCCHQGRTPPCADAVIRAGITRVVTGMPDPNPLVSGGGLARLRAAGIEVQDGVLAEDCRELNAQFARYMAGGVFVTLKGAMTLDGCIAAPEQKPDDRRITGQEAQAYVQLLRHRHDALITGAGTVLADDPILNDRSGLPRRRPLLRVVMDSGLRLPPGGRLAQSARGDLLVVCVHEASPARQQALEARGVEVLRLSTSGRTPLDPVLAALHRREITSALLEAGSALNATVLEGGLVDKVVLFYAPKILGGQDALPLFGGRGFRTLCQARPVRITELRRVGDDFVVEGYLRETEPRP
jgi:diaminohydroxyphosphoribosylaminopyrimidine deaminase/5-amino-6-(5-phosphoribosylamino)uracil reductase